MIEILDSPGYLASLKVSGEITAGDITKAAKAIEDIIKANDRVSIFVEVEDSARYTLEGFFKDVIEGLNRLNDLGHIYRVALVTNKGWMSAMTRLEGVVFASIDMRVFEPAERDRGLAWASELPPPRVEPQPRATGLRLIQTTKPSVVAFEITGQVGDAEIKTLAAAMRDAFKSHERINMFARMSGYTGFDLAAFLNEDLYTVKLKGLTKVDKYAVVDPKPWIRNWIELVNPLFKVDARIFDASEEKAAWDWVGAAPALLPE